jgi:hypothetical protein
VFSLQATLNRIYTLNDDTNHQPSLWVPDEMSNESSWNVSNIGGVDDKSVSICKLVDDETMTDSKVV